MYGRPKQWQSRKKWIANRPWLSGIGMLEREGSKTSKSSGNSILQRRIQEFIINKNQEEWKRDQEYQRRRQRRTRQKKNMNRMRRLKVIRCLYIPAVLGLTLGIIMIFGATIRTLSDGTIFWTYRHQFVIAGTVTLVLGVVFLLLAAGLENETVERIKKRTNAERIYIEEPVDPNFSIKQKCTPCPSQESLLRNDPLASSSASSQFGDSSKLNLTRNWARAMKISVCSPDSKIDETEEEVSQITGGDPYKTCEIPERSHLLSVPPEREAKLTQLAIQCSDRDQSHLLKLPPDRSNRRPLRATKSLSIEEKSGQSMVKKKNSLDFETDLSKFSEKMYSPDNASSGELKKKHVVAVHFGNKVETKLQSNIVDTGHIVDPDIPNGLEIQADMLDCVESQSNPHSICNGNINIVADDRTEGSNHSGVGIQIIPSKNSEDITVIGDRKSNTGLIKQPVLQSVVSRHTTGTQTTPCQLCPHGRFTCEPKFPGNGIKMGIRRSLSYHHEFESRNYADHVV